MNRRESSLLNFLSTSDKLDNIRNSFFEGAEINKEEKESIWIEIKVKNERKEELLKKLDYSKNLSDEEKDEIKNQIAIEPDSFPEEKSISFEERLMNLYESYKREYLKKINEEFYAKALNPNEKINLIQLLKEDLEDIINVYKKSNHIDKYKNLKDKIISELNLIHNKIDILDFKISDSSLDRNKIKFNLTKKEVCILFQYLSKHNLISGGHTQEELAKLIEKHAMYKSKGNYHFITNAKNTLSKNQNDLEHQSLSETLSKHLKLYK